MATLVGSPVLSDEASFTADRTVALPNGVTTGDVIFCVWVTANEHTINSLGDFTQIGTTETSSAESMSIAYKISDGSEGASITFTDLFSVTESGSTLCFAYRGLDTADLIESVAQANLSVAGTSVSGPSITPVNDGCLILQINGSDPGGPSMTPDTIATEVFDGQDAGNYSYFGVQSYEQTTAEAIALDATFTESLQYISFQIAFNQSSGAETAGLPASTLRVNGAAIVSTSVTRIVTLGGTEVFNGSVSTNASGVLPELDLSATAVVVDDALVDRIEFTGSAPYRSAIEFTVLAENIAE